MVVIITHVVCKWDGDEGNDVPTWYQKGSAEATVTEMRALKAEWAIRGITLVYIDVVPASDQTAY